MPYFSIPIPESLLRQSGSFTKFKTVVHQNHQICGAAAKQIQAEFNEAMGTDIITNTVAQVPKLGHVHFLAFTIPNCLPERLVALARFAEFTLLNDDFYDIAKSEEIQVINDDIQSVLTGETGPRTNESLSNMTMSKQLQSSLILDMVNIDSELAMDIMTTYSKGLDLATFPPDTLKTLDDYLPVRMVNSGLDVFQTMSCFGMGISLSAAEKAHLNDLVNTAMFSTTMINDVHSWPKEIKHHIEHPGSELPFNAVAVLMRHQGCSEAEAIARMREKQAELQNAHLELLRELEARGPIPEHHMLYILAAQYAASGSEFWSVYVPRYPSKKDLCQPEVEFVNGEFRYVKTDGADTQVFFEVGRDDQTLGFKKNGTSISVVEIGRISPDADDNTRANQEIPIEVVEIRPKASVGNMKGSYASALAGGLGETPRSCVPPANGIARPVVSKKASMQKIKKKASTCSMTKNQADGRPKLNGHVNGQINRQNGHPVNGLVNGQTSTHSINGTRHASNSSSRNHVTKDADLPHALNGSSSGTESTHGSETSSVACTDEIIMAPYKYLTSMPSKGIRELFITALNWWLAVPESELLVIKEVIGYLHQSSLMLDDIEDDSQLRRGQPSTHIIYGLGQTINSANYIFVQSFARMQVLGNSNPETTSIFIEEVENLHKGQAYDLFWKDQVECPSVDEYYMMIDNKTGGLFRLCVRLMEALATQKFPGISSEFFVSQLSRYFQIRDDYQNLMSDQYAKEKGFAEDLDEGKISLPLIYTLQTSPNRAAIARVYKRRDPSDGQLGLEMKLWILSEMRKCGALDRTHALLLSMQSSLLQELKRLETEFGAANASLELVLRKLWLK